ncbi:RNA 3'-terminal phosphate cyclase [Thermofilum pendens]|uniref:RNA 3'-terminal phosphate cyclase n=1 Tax=Thermofilum pendens (strain DSM 2475 / Hrk 5) TaxID=368408 RepID=A1RWP7_THEPD|nr:RNA 3'-terminal phosphate cyclase [Thermofilum pendens]ABL77627.1 RNA-3'-phosphate cyclase [Thermofilum pendens Hrk 5]
MIEIDGSMGEGGGQLLRYSIALSAIMNVPLRIYNIRAKRDPPGLRPQHLTALKFIAELVKGEAEGLRVGSTEVKFVPRLRRPAPGKYVADIGTAGSVTLLLQASLPVLLAAEGKVGLEVRGGTSVRWSPPYRYFENVLIPLISKFGAKISSKLLREGFYPEGGGAVYVETTPGYPLEPINLTAKSTPGPVEGASYVGNLPCHIAERQARSARERIESAGFNVGKVNVVCNQPATGRGSGIVLWARVGEGVVGSDALGERGKPAEDVGREAAERLLPILKAGAPVDPHASDNLVIYMSLARGESAILTTELTSHAETALELCRQITGATYTVERTGNGVLIKVKGVGYSP